MDCTNLANDIAQAFVALMDASMMTGAALIAVGYLLGAAPRLFDWMVDWDTRRKESKCPTP